ncbi:MAG TPA: hypothetical protein VNG13_09655 [Mycobacteriales bacterium]|nr:hypothetical protein [Mycobacteriales bacterium]
MSTAALPAVRTGAARSRAIHDGAAEVEADRDRRTVERLTTGLVDADVLAFEPGWWDGAVRGPAVVVRIRGQRHRLVEVAGRVLVLPGRDWRSRRALGRWRRGEGPVSAVAAQPAPGTDVLTCHHLGCGGLRAVADRRCPACGRR